MLPVSILDRWQVHARHEKLHAGRRAGRKRRGALGEFMESNANRGVGGKTAVWRTAVALGRSTLRETGDVDDELLFVLLQMDFGNGIHG